MERNANLYAHFEERFRRAPDKVAVDTAAGASLRYTDLAEASARIANGLAARGLQPGDRVSVQVAKSPQALLLYLACLRAGFVFHPLNPAYKRDELRHFLSDAEPALLICDPDDAGTLTPFSEELGVPRVLTLGPDGRGSLMDQCAAASSRQDAVPRQPDDPAVLLYSSGTTGVPKGIVLTHRNLLSNGETLVDAWGFGADDVLLHALPIYHVHGLFVAIHCVLLSGASMRWLKGFDVQAVLRELPGCSCMMGVPTYYVRLLASTEFGEEHCRDMRLFTSGSAPLLADTFHDFEARTGHRILERYGMTETGMTVSNPLHGERRAGTVGLPLPGVTIRVVGEDGSPLPSGEIGGLQVKGPNVFPGYWRLPEKTAEDFTADGFFDTGDQAVIADDGYVSIVGRAKDMVITGGLNVYPKELELVIDALPGVRESAVIGVPHPDFGEGIVAVLVPESGASALPEEGDLLARLKEKVAGFKVPKRLLVVDELPRNAMGKVQKNRLRERYAALFEKSSS